MSMGLETAVGVMTKLVERNIIIPSNKGPTFMTHADSQLGVHVQVFERDRAVTKDNNSV